MYVFHPSQITNAFFVDRPIVYKTWYMDPSTPKTKCNRFAISKLPGTSKESNAVIKKVDLSSISNKKIASRYIKYRLRETATSYQIVLDVPGVKICDLAIEIDKGDILKVMAQRQRIDGKIINYQRCFRIDKKYVEKISNAKAELKAGVLTIELIKADPTEPKVLEVIVSDPPVNLLKTTNDFLVTFDIPGVKSTDINATYHGGKINFVANRKCGNNNIIKISKLNTINKDMYDVQNLKVYLVNGICTLYAPMLENNIITSTNGATGEQNDLVKKIVVSFPNSEPGAGVTDMTDDDDDTVVVNHLSVNKSKWKFRPEPIHMGHSA